MMRASAAQRLLVRGKGRLQAGDASAAVADLTAALDSEPRLSLALFHRGEAFARLGRWREALRDFDSVLERMPDHAPSRYQRGMIFSRLGRHAEARRELGYVPPAQGAALFGSGKLRAAGRSLDSALSSRPESGDARVLRGIVRRLQSDVSGALEDFSGALRLAPAELWRRAFGEEECRRVPEKKAQADFERLRALRAARPGDAAASAFFGIAARRFGFWDEGRRALLEAAALHPPSRIPAREWAAKHLCWSAEAKLFGGDRAGAFLDAGRAFRLSGRAAWARAWRGAMSLWCGRYREALRELDACLRAPEASFTPGSRGWAFAWRGGAKLRLGLAEEGLADIRFAVENSPSDPEAQVWLAEALLLRGRRKEAEEALERASALRPDQVWPCLLRAAFGLGDAEEMLKEAGRLCPGLVSLARSRSAGMGARAAARAALELSAGNRTLQPTCLSGRGARSQLIPVFKRAPGEAGDAAREAAYRVDADRGWVYAWKGAPLSGRAEHRRLLARLVRRPSGGAEALAWRGELERKLGDPAAALRTLGRALRIDPRLACARAWRAEALRDLARHGEARAELARAAALAPEEAWIHALLGRAWTDFTPAHLSRALESLDRALARAGTDASRGWMLAWRGEALRRLKRHRLALRDLDRALVLGSPPAWTLTCRAEVKRKLGDFSGALRDLTKAERFSPGYAWTRVTRSEICRKKRRFDEALRHLEAAVAASRGAAWAYALLGRAQANYRFRERGLANLDRSLRLDPKAGWTLAWRGEILRRMGRLGAAKRDLDAAVRLDPDYAWAWAWRGGVLRQLGCNKEALPSLNEAIRLQENYPWAFAERSRVRRDLGDVRGAFDDLEKAQRMDSKYTWLEHPSQQKAALGALERFLGRRPRDARAWAWKGRSFADLGIWEEALSSLDRALALAPGHARALAWRGEALDRLGRTEEALKDLDKAVSRDGTYPRAHAWRGRALARTGRLASAKKALDRSIRLEPRWAAAFLWRAEVRALLGDRRGARADADDALGLSADFKEARLLRKML